MNKTALAAVAGAIVGVAAMGSMAMCLPDEAPTCEDGYTLAEDNTCVAPGYYDVPPTPEAPMPDRTLVPCPEEDSDNCYWDAAQRGNGVGTSFITLDGVTYYPEG